MLSSITGGTNEAPKTIPEKTREMLEGCENGDGHNKDENKLYDSIVAKQLQQKLINAADTCNYEKRSGTAQSKLKSDTPKKTWEHPESLADKIRRNPRSSAYIHTLSGDVSQEEFEHAIKEQEKEDRKHQRKDLAPSLFEEASGETYFPFGNANGVDTDTDTPWQSSEASPVGEGEEREEHALSKEENDKRLSPPGGNGGEYSKATDAKAVQRPPSTEQQQEQSSGNTDDNAVLQKMNSGFKGSKEKDKEIFSA